MSESKITSTDEFLLVTALFFAAIAYFSFVLRFMSIHLTFLHALTFFSIVIISILLAIKKMNISHFFDPLAVFIFIFALFLRLYLPMKYIFVGTNIDGPRHLDYIFSLHHSAGFESTYSFHGMQHYPPGYHLIVSYFWTLTRSENLYFVMGIPALLSACTVLSIYSVTLHIYNKKAALFAGFFAAISRPLIFMVLYSYYSQTVATFYVGIVLLSFILYLKSRDIAYLFVVMTILGVTMITYDPIFTIIVFMCIFIWSLTTRILKKWHVVAIIVLCSLALAYPHLKSESVREKSNLYVFEGLKQRLFENETFEVFTHEDKTLYLSFNFITYLVLFTSVFGCMILLLSKNDTQKIVAQMYLVYFFAMGATRTIIIDNYVSFKISLSFFMVYITSGVFFSFMHSKLKFFSPTTKKLRISSSICTIVIILLALVPYEYKIENTKEYFPGLTPYIPQTGMGIKAGVHFQRSVSDEDFDIAYYIRDTFNESEVFFLAKSYPQITRRLTAGYISALSHHTVAADIWTEQLPEYQYTIIIDDNLPTRFRDYKNVAIIPNDDERIFLRGGLVPYTPFIISMLYYYEYNITEAPIEIYTFFQFMHEDVPRFVENPYILITYGDYSWGAEYIIKEGIFGNETDRKERMQYFESGYSTTLMPNLTEGFYHLHIGYHDFGTFNEEYQYSHRGREDRYVSSFSVVR